MTVSWGQAAQILEVDEGATRDQVRRAYARKLRTTNPEDDPSGFMRLREAHDLLMRFADAAPSVARDGDKVLAVAADNAPPALAEVAPGERIEPLAPTVTLDVPSAPAAPSSSPASVHQQILADLIAQQRAFEQQLGDCPDDLGTLERKFRLILDSESLNWRITSQIDSWASAILACHIDDRRIRDALAPLAADRFGWADAEQAGEASVIVAALVQADAARRYIVELKQTPARAGWIALSRPHTRLERLRFALGRTQGVIAEILSVMDADLPALADYLDAGELAYWQAFVLRPRVRGGAVIAAGVVAFLIAYAILFYVSARTTTDAQAHAMIGLAALVLPLVAALPWIDVFALQVPNWRWNGLRPGKDMRAQAHPRHRSAWLATGWAALGLTAILFSLVSQSVPGGQAIQLLGCAAAIYWCLVTRELHPIDIPRRQLPLGRVCGFGIVCIMVVTTARANILVAIGSVAVVAVLRTAGRTRLYKLLRPVYHQRAANAWLLEIGCYTAWSAAILATALSIYIPMAQVAAANAGFLGYLFVSGTALDLAERRGWRAVLLALMAFGTWVGADAIPLPQPPAGTNDTTVPRWTPSPSTPPTNHGPPPPVLIPRPQDGDPATEPVWVVPLPPPATPRRKTQHTNAAPTLSPPVAVESSARVSENMCLPTGTGRPLSPTSGHRRDG